MKKSEQLLQDLALWDITPQAFSKVDLVLKYASEIAKDAFFQGVAAQMVHEEQRATRSVKDEFDEYWKSVTNKTNKEILDFEIDDEWFEPRKDGLNPYPDTEICGKCGTVI